MDVEIEEDEAFNSEDERKYGDLFASISARREKNAASDEEEREEDEDDESEDENGGGMLLSDMLNGSNDKEIARKAAEEERQRLKLLETLDLKPKKPKTKTAERTEVVDENEHYVPPSRGSVKLNIADLMGNVGSIHSNGKDADAVELSAANATLRKQLAKLGKEKTVVQPVARVVQERLERKMNYKESQKEVSDWIPFVQANRKSEHLSFVALNQAQRQKLTTASIMASHEPATDMEKRVQSLLKAGGVENEKMIRKKEERELMSSEISHEDVVARRKELQKMRALMYYEEQKSKRIKKIKSKLYHKLKKKRGRREAEKRQALLWETNPELAKEMAEKEERKRIKLRMTLKHRNTSKWMKKALKRGGGGTDGAKAAVLEQLRERELLHQKIMGGKKHVKDGETSESDDEDDSSLGPEGVKRKLREKAVSVLREIDEDANEDDDAKSTKKKGIFGMKFMQHSLQKQRQAARMQAQALLDEIDGIDEEGEKRIGHSTDKDANQGRRTFDGKTKKGRQGAYKPVDATSEKQIRDEMPDRSVQILAAQNQAGRVTSLTTQSAITIGGVADATRRTNGESSFSVPAFTGVDSSTMRSEDTDAAPCTATNPWMKSQAKAKGRFRSKAHKANDASSKNEKEEVFDVAEAVKTLETEANTKTVGKRRRDDDDEQHEQRDIVKRAFVDAGAENDFKLEKEALINNELESTMDDSPEMAGWGSWAGEGVVVTRRAKRRKRQREIRRERERSEKRQSIASNRKDATKPNVIINEKRNKKAARYNVKSVPYPFTSRAQYEQSLKRTIGRECNTSRLVDKETRPEVYTRAGVIITPARKPKKAR